MEENGKMLGENRGKFVRKREKNGFRTSLSLCWIRLWVLPRDLYNCWGELKIYVMFSSRVVCRTSGTPLWLCPCKNPSNTVTSSSSLWMYLIGQKNVGQKSTNFFRKWRNNYTEFVSKRTLDKIYRHTQVSDIFVR